MIRQDRVQTLRQTHATISSLMPIITAGLTVTGAIIAAIETRRASSESGESGEERQNPGAQPHPSADPSRRRAPRSRVIRRYIATLAGRLLLVLLGFALVLAITLAATSSGRVGQAVTITALILLTLYLVEKVARQA